MEVKKSLFLNGLEVVRIQKTAGETLFMKCSDYGMVCVPYSAFITHFKSLAYVFITSYDTKLIEEYKEFDSFIKNTVI